MIRYLVPARKVRFFVGWVESELQCWVSPPPADQPMNIKYLAQYDFKGETQQVE